MTSIMNQIANILDQSFELFSNQALSTKKLDSMVPTSVKSEFCECEKKQNNIDFLLTECGYYLETLKYKGENKALFVNPETKDKVVIPYFIAMYITREKNTLNGVDMYSLYWGWNTHDGENNVKMMFQLKESKNINFMNSGLNFCSDIWKNPLKKALNDAHTYCEWLTYKLNKFGYYKTESIKNIKDIVPNPEFIEYLIFDNPIEN